MAFPAVWAITANALGAETFRQATSSLLAGTGVVGPADLAVTENGTPNMSVNVAPGQVWIPGTLSATTGFNTNLNNQSGYGLPASFNEQGCYQAWNNSTVNVAIAAADPTNPRIDLVCAYVQDAQYSGSNNQGVIGVITGTAAASPVAPSAPASAVVLAQVAVAAGATSITTGDVTDVRPVAGVVSPVQPACRVFRNAAYTDVSTTYTTCPFDTVQFLSGGGSFSTSTSEYTVPEGGYYQVSGGWSVAATSGWLQAMVGHNGAVWSLGVLTCYASTPGVLQSSHSDLVYCDPGDTLNFLYLDSGAHSINTNSAFCFMSIVKVSN
jgi:hypothetical protein